MKQIQLTRGKFALVDDEDYDSLISMGKWTYQRCGYAVKFKNLGKFNGKQKNKMISMHRVINRTPEGIGTDHIDGNKLNNQRFNLRTATSSQNNANKPVKKHTSIYKGVHWFRKAWKATIRTKSGRVHLGYFKNEHEAAIAYNNAAIEHHGAFAWINKIVIP